jgi:hypothetical protein
VPVIAAQIAIRCVARPASIERPPSAFGPTSLIAITRQRRHEGHQRQEREEEFECLGVHRGIASQLESLDSPE